MSVDVYVQKIGERQIIITFLSVKGGVSKSTSAVHIAAYFQTLAPTLLLDGDDTRNVTAWCQRGPGFPFRVADEVQAARLARDFTHVVIDTGQKPSGPTFRRSPKAVTCW